MSPAELTAPLLAQGCSAAMAMTGRQGMLHLLTCMLMIASALATNAGRLALLSIHDVPKYITAVKSA